MLSEDEFEILNFLWIFPSPITHPKTIAIADGLVKKGYLKNLAKWVYQFTKEGSEIYKSEVEAGRV